MHAGPRPWRSQLCGGRLDSPSGTGHFVAQTGSSRKPALGCAVGYLDDDIVSLESAGWAWRRGEIAASFIRHMFWRAIIELE